MTVPYLDAVLIRAQLQALGEQAFTVKSPCPQRCRFPHAHADVTLAVPINWQPPAQWRGEWGLREHEADDEPIHFEEEDRSFTGSKLDRYRLGQGYQRGRFGSATEE